MIDFLISYQTFKLFFLKMPLLHKDCSRDNILFKSTKEGFSWGGGGGGQKLVSFFTFRTSLYISTKMHWVLMLLTYYRYKLGTPAYMYTTYCWACAISWPSCHCSDIRCPRGDHWQGLSTTSWSWSNATLCLLQRTICWCTNFNCKWQKW